MKREFFEHNMAQMVFQRNILLLLSVIMAVSLVILSSFLFFKRERVIVTPAHIEKEFWVDGVNVSPTYLEQFGYFLSQLLLSKSSYSAATQRTILLRHADPTYVGLLKQKLLDEEEVLKKQNASYAFYPIETKVDLNKMEVFLLGDRAFYVLGKEVSVSRESYILSFSYSGSRLLLNGISAEKKL